jgi:CheY-like chemotaxis protein
VSPDDLRVALRESAARECRLASELESLRRQVQERLSSQDALLEALSQELREPLTALGTAAQVILQAAGQDEHCRWAVSLVERQLHRMTRVADDLLDLSQLAQGKVQLQLEGLDLEPVLRAALATVDAQLRLRGQTLSLPAPSPLPVWGDRARLVQMFGLLLDDASSHGALASAIRVSATCEAGEVVVRIPAGEVRTDDLGQPAAASVRRRLAHRLLELHGGTLGETPDAVVVRFPAAAAPLVPRGPPELPAPPRPITSRRILVVDDHRDTAEALARVLEVRGHQTLAVHSGQRALDVLESFRPDAVLLDLGLPVMDGLEVARRIRARSDLRDLILVAATGRGDQEDRRRSLLAGFDHHLVKPLRPESIEAVLMSDAAVT